MKINPNIHSPINSNNRNSLVASANFEQVMEQVNFSKHANMRLEARNINLSNSQMERVQNGINKAESKGIKDSLVLVDNIALLVNIANRVVVTAVNQSDKVFTNIDGAVIV